MQSFDLIELIVLIIISGFFSGSELAYIVSNKLKIEVRARRNNIAAQSALFFTNNPQDFFSTILIANNLVNISFASLSTVFLLSVFGMGELNVLIISSFFLLFFGELVPKYFAGELADRVIYISSLPIRAVYFVLYPFIKFTSSISNLVTQNSNVKAENISYLFSKEDIESLVKESHAAGMVNKKESDIISKVFDLGDQRVYEAMRPRTDIVGIELTSSVEDAISVFIDSGYSKLPVYEDNLDNIKGMIHAYDMFKFPESIQSILKEAVFVPETKRTFDMLNEFLSKQISIAIVIDEFGGTAGVVTIEDIVEELFGEIKDEYDIEESIFRRISPNGYLISGRVEIDLINEKYSLGIPSGDYETIGGYIISKIGRIPDQGENLKIDDFNILIVRALQTHIELVKLIINPEAAIQ